MLKDKFRSLLVKRLFPALMVPVLLCSNYATINVAADGIAAETIEDDSQDTDEGGEPEEDDGDVQEPGDESAGDDNDNNTPSDQQNISDGSGNQNGNGDGAVEPADGTPADPAAEPTDGTIEGTDPNALDPTIDPNAIDPTLDPSLLDPTLNPNAMDPNLITSSLTLQGGQGSGPRDLEASVDATLLTNSEWYTDSNRAKIQVKVEANRQIEKISIKCGDETICEKEVKEPEADPDDDPFNLGGQLGDTYTADETLEIPGKKSGSHEYKAVVTFKPTLLSSGKTTKKADNTFTLRYDINNPNAEGYKISIDENSVKVKSQNVFITVNDFDYVIKIPTSCDGDAENDDGVSGLATDKFQVLLEGKSEAATAKYDGEAEGYYVFRVSSTQWNFNWDEFDLQEYNIDKFTFSDVAGNNGEKVVNPDSYRHGVKDRRAPKVSYEGAENLYVDENNVYYEFVNAPVQRKVVVEDNFALVNDDEHIVFTTQVDTSAGEVTDDKGNTVATSKLSINKKNPVAEHHKRYKDNIVKLTYTYSLGGDEGEEYEYLFTTQARDVAGNPVNKEPEAFPSPCTVVDMKNPHIQVSYSGNLKDSIGAAVTDKISDGELTITLRMTEGWANFDQCGIKYDFDGEGGGNTISGEENWSEVGDGEYELTFHADKEGRYSNVEVFGVDLAGNVAEISGLDYSSFVVDLNNPVIDSVTFNDAEAENGKYYKETRVATVTITDYTFSEELVSIEGDLEKANIGGFTNIGGNTWQGQITFSNDGKYKFTVNCRDCAGKSADPWAVDEFVIDKTEPVITVTYDNYDAKNGNFYKDARTATVNIQEISFDQKLVNVSVQEIGDVTGVPSISGFTTRDDRNVATISFDQDGTYAYVVNCKDLAGNTATAFISDTFVIDTTAPEVKFAGVENFSANNGVVAPALTYNDKNMDMNATSVTMTGSNNGAVALSNTVTKLDDGFSVTYGDFPHDKSMDDLYVLDATVIDLAGNETKEQLVFSVNRFGSVFVLGDATKALNEQYYVKEGQDVSITEINVDDLTYRDISVSRDGNIRQLKNGRGYKVAKQGSDTTWKTFTYTVSKDNFKKDGVYSVTVYTEDRATNTQDNKSRDAEINFAVDGAAPSIVTAGIEEDAYYQEASHSFNIDVNDNMGVTKLTVYKDGRIINEFDEEQLTADGGIETITLQESEAAQTISITAEDVAGNRETVAYKGVVVSTKPQPSSGSTTGNGGGSSNGGNGGNGGTPEVLGEHRVPVAVIITFVTLAAVAMAAGAGIMIRRKKSNE